MARAGRQIKATEQELALFKSHTVIGSTAQVVNLVTLRTARRALASLQLPQHLIDQLGIQTSAPALEGSFCGVLDITPSLPRYDNLDQVPKGRVNPAVFEDLAHRHGRSAPVQHTIHQIQYSASYLSGTEFAWPCRYGLAGTAPHLLKRALLSQQLGKLKGWLQAEFQFNREGRPLRCQTVKRLQGNISVFLGFSYNCMGITEPNLQLYLDVEVLLNFFRLLTARGTLSPSVSKHFNTAGKVWQLHTLESLQVTAVTGNRVMTVSACRSSTSLPSTRAKPPRQLLCRLSRSGC